MSPRLRVPVIGVGAIAQLAQLPTLSRVRGMEVVALCDNDGPKARSLADRKELNGKPAQLSPTGASARDRAFIQPYRAQAAHVAAVLSGDALYEPPTDQLLVHRIIEAAYRSGDDAKEVRL